jgi:hypothetical protein
MENNEIPINAVIEDEGLMIYPKFNEPLDTSEKFPLQYEYIDVFIDLILREADYNSDKIGFISSVDEMKYFWCLTLSKYDECNTNKIIKVIEDNENP